MLKYISFIIFLIIFPFTIFANYELSICAIFKNEGPYLKEWIEFHKLQGVQHFYLYNNNSTDDFEKILKPYIKSREVTLINWPYTFKSGETHKWLKIQKDAYNNCLNDYGSDSIWIAFIDIDEFLFCINGTPLPAFLANYRDYGGVCAHWLLFGTSNIENIPKGSLLIELLNRCSLENHIRNNQTKSIIQPKRVVNAKSAHHFNYKKGYFHVDEHYRRFDIHGPITHDLIRINHYWTRTESYFRMRKMPSRNNRRNLEDADILRSMANDYDKKTDTVIHQFIPALRKQMGFQ